MSYQENIACHPSRLPRDVLIDLFSFFITSRSTLFIASHVCHSWRQTIQESSEFWSSLEFFMESDGLDIQAAYWLERTGTRPLSISITYPKRLSKSPESRQTDAESHRIQLRTDKLARVLKQKLEHFQNVSIVDALHSDLSILLRIWKGRTPKLVNLSIQTAGKDVDEPMYRPKLFFLRDSIDDGGTTRLTFRNCVPMISHYLGLKVTSLHLKMDEKVDSSAATGSILFTLVNCPNIVTLSLEVPQHRYVGRNASVISVPHLTSLKLHGIADAHHLLAALVCPSLQSLDISGLLWVNLSAVAIEIALRIYPLLSHFELSGWARFEIEAPPVAGPLVLPNIETFKILGSSDPIRPLLRQLVLPNVKNLALEGVSPTLTDRFISSSAAITSLTLHDIGRLSSDPITVSTLTHLDLSASFSFFDHLASAPNLTSLALCDSGRRSTPFSTPLRHMLERCHPPLRELALHRIAVNDYDLIWCLRLVPHLERLEFKNCHNTTDVVLEALSGPAEPGERSLGSGGWLLPRLKEIKILKMARISPQGVIDFLTSRNSASPPAPTDVNVTTPNCVGGVVGFPLNTSEGDREAVRVSHSSSNACDHPLMFSMGLSQQLGLLVEEEFESEFDDDEIIAF